MPCFSAGTYITTDQGDIAVENLKQGQMVLTRDNGYQPVRWIGKRPMSGRHLLDNPHLKPVLVRQDTFGKGLPFADMKLSQNARVPLASAAHVHLGREKDDRVSIKHMVNHGTVQAIDTLGLSYVHVMFDQHEIISANGIWIEAFNVQDQSLRNVGNAQRLEIYEIFPNLKTRPRTEKQAVEEEKVFSRRVNVSMLRRFL